ncbi:MAG: glyoxalase/bleomycin resistance protein/dioxygenase [Osedax symbiont Rs2]|nr:MAG: glyoxalase/bleomycin resistance protein/dioxygenase [Osedax symbiont Rs2]
MSENILNTAASQSEPPAQRPPSKIELAITFIYFYDLAQAMAFYEDVLGLELEIDQGWAKIYKISAAAHLGLVDQAVGMHRANEVKPVQLCIRVADVDAWHTWIASCDVQGLTVAKSNFQLGIRAFVFNDPEGYQIEVQSVL